MPLNVRFSKLLESRYSNLSANEEKVAIFLREHPEDLLDMSVLELSERTGVSQATVVRFCKSLGYRGMKELKIAMGGVNSTPEEHTAPLSWGDSVEEVLSKALYHAESSIETIFSTNKPEILSKATSVLAEASSIDIIGVGGSAIVASHARTEFMRLGKRTECFTDQYFLSQLMRSASPSTPLIVISCSGETEPVVEAFRAMKEKGTFTIAITGQADSTLAKEADVTILAPRQEVFLDDKDSFSRISQLTLVTALYLLTAIEIGRKDEKFRESYQETTNYRQLPKKD